MSDSSIRLEGILEISQENINFGDVYYCDHDNSRKENSVIVIVKNSSYVESCEIVSIFCDATQGVDYPASLCYEIIDENESNNSKNEIESCNECRYTLEPQGLLRIKCVLLTSLHESDYATPRTSYFFIASHTIISYKIQNESAQEVYEVVLPTTATLCVSVMHVDEQFYAFENCSIGETYSRYIQLWNRSECLLQYSLDFMVELESDSSTASERDMTIEIDNLKASPMLPVVNMQIWDTLKPVKCNEINDISTFAAQRVRFNITPKAAGTYFIKIKVLNIHNMGNFYDVVYKINVPNIENKTLRHLYLIDDKILSEVEYDMNMLNVDENHFDLLEFQDCYYDMIKIKKAWVCNFSEVSKKVKLQAEFSNRDLFDLCFTCDEDVASILSNDHIERQFLAKTYKLLQSSDINPVHNVLSIDVQKILQIDPMYDFNSLNANDDSINSHRDSNIQCLESLIDGNIETHSNSFTTRSSISQHLGLDDDNLDDSNSFIEASSAKRDYSNKKYHNAAKVCSMIYGSDLACRVLPVTSSDSLLLPKHHDSKVNSSNLLSSDADIHPLEIWYHRMNIVGDGGPVISNSKISSMFQRHQRRFLGGQVRIEDLENFVDCERKEYSTFIKSFPHPDDNGGSTSNTACMDAETISTSKIGLAKMLRFSVAKMDLHHSFVSREIELDIPKQSKVFVYLIYFSVSDASVSRSNLDSLSIGNLITSNVKLRLSCTECDNALLSKYKSYWLYSLYLSKTVSNQPLTTSSMYTNVRFNLYRSICTLSMSSSIYDFGECSVGEIYKAVIYIKNISAIPAIMIPYVESQSLLLSKSHHEVSTDRYSTTLILLPEETRAIHFEYTALLENTNYKREVIIFNSNNPSNHLVIEFHAKNIDTHQVLQHSLYYKISGVNTRKKENNMMKANGKSMKEQTTEQVQMNIQRQLHLYFNRATYNMPNIRTFRIRNIQAHPIILEISSIISSKDSLNDDELKFISIESLITSIQETSFDIIATENVIVEDYKVPMAKQRYSLGTELRSSINKGLDVEFVGNDHSVDDDILARVARRSGKQRALSLHNQDDILVSYGPSSVGTDVLNVMKSKSTSVHLKNKSDSTNHSKDLSSNLSLLSINGDILDEDASCNSPRNDNTSKNQRILEIIRAADTPDFPFDFVFPDYKQSFQRNEIEATSSFSGVDPSIMSTNIKKLQNLIKDIKHLLPKQSSSSIIATIPAGLSFEFAVVFTPAINRFDYSNHDALLQWNEISKLIQFKLLSVSLENANKLMSKCFNENLSDTNILETTTNVQDVDLLNSETIESPLVNILDTSLQLRPRLLTLKAKISLSELSLSQKNIDFGKLFVGESSSRTITLKNHSQSPLFYSILKSGSISSGFLQIPSGVYGEVPPNSVFTIDILIKPGLAGTFEEIITIENILDPINKHSVVVKAKVSKPEIFKLYDNKLPTSSSQISSSVVVDKYELLTPMDVGMVAVGASSEVSILFSLKNLSQRRRQFIVDANHSDAVLLKSLAGLISPFEETPLIYESITKISCRFTIVSETTPSNVPQSDVTVEEKQILKDKLETFQQKLKIAVRKNKAEKIIKYERKIELISDILSGKVSAVIDTSLEDEDESMKVGLTETVEVSNKEISETVIRSPLYSYAKILANSDTSLCFELDSNHEVAISVALTLLPGTSYKTWKGELPFYGYLRVFEAKNEDVVKIVPFDCLLFSSQKSLQLSNKNLSNKTSPHLIESTSISTNNLLIGENTEDVSNALIFPNTKLISQNLQKIKPASNVILTTVAQWSSYPTKQIFADYREKTQNILGVCIKLVTVNKEGLMQGMVSIDSLLSKDILITINFVDPLDLSFIDTSHIGKQVHMEKVVYDPRKHGYIDFTVESKDSSNILFGRDILNASLLGNSKADCLLQWKPSSSVMKLQQLIVACLCIQAHGVDNNDVICLQYIPVVCQLEKRSTIQLADKYINFGEISVGEIKVASLNISNTSEIDKLHYTSTLSSSSSSSNKSQLGRVVIKGGMTGSLNPLDSKTITLELRTLKGYIGRFEQELWIVNLNNQFDQKKVSLVGNIIVDPIKYVRYPMLQQLNIQNGVSENNTSTMTSQKEILDTPPVKSHGFTCIDIGQVQIVKSNSCIAQRYHYKLEIENISKEYLHLTAISNLKHQCFIFADEECSISPRALPFPSLQSIALYILIKPSLPKSTSKNDVNVMLLGRELLGGIRLEYSLSDETNTSDPKSTLFETSIEFKATVGYSLLRCTLLSGNFVHIKYDYDIPIHRKVRFENDCPLDTSFYALEMLNICIENLSSTFDSKFGFIDNPLVSTTPFYCIPIIPMNTKRNKNDFLLLTLTHFNLMNIQVKDPTIVIFIDCDVKDLDLVNDFDINIPASLKVVLDIGIVYPKMVENAYINGLMHFCICTENKLTGDLSYLRFEAFFDCSFIICEYPNSDHYFGDIQSDAVLLVDKNHSNMRSHLTSNEDNQSIPELSFNILGSTRETLFSWEISNQSLISFNIIPYSDLPIVVHISPVIDIHDIEGVTPSNDVVNNISQSFNTLCLERCGEPIVIKGKSRMKVCVTSKIGAQVSDNLLKKCSLKSLIGAFEEGNRISCPGIIALVSTNTMFNDSLVFPVLTYTRLFVSFVYPQLKVNSNTIALGSLRCGKNLEFVCEVENLCDCPIAFGIDNLPSWIQHVLPCQSLFDSSRENMIIKKLQLWLADTSTFSSNLVEKSSFTKFDEDQDVESLGLPDASIDFSDIDLEHISLLGLQTYSVLESGRDSQLIKRTQKKMVLLENSMLCGLFALIEKFLSISTDQINNGARIGLKTYFVKPKMKFSIPLLVVAPRVETQTLDHRIFIQNYLAQSSTIDCLVSLHVDSIKAIEIYNENGMPLQVSGPHATPFISLEQHLMVPPTSIFSDTTQNSQAKANISLIPQPNLTLASYSAVKITIKNCLKVTAQVLGTFQLSQQLDSMIEVFLLLSGERLPTKRLSTSQDNSKTLTLKTIDLMPGEETLIQICVRSIRGSSINIERDIIPLLYDSSYRGLIRRNHSNSNLMTTLTSSAGEINETESFDDEIDSLSGGEGSIRSHFSIDEFEEQQPPNSDVMRSLPSSASSIDQVMRITTPVVSEMMLRTITPSNDFPNLIQPIKAIGNDFQSILSSAPIEHLSNQVNTRVDSDLGPILLGKFHLRSNEGRFSNQENQSIISNFQNFKDISVDIITKIRASPTIVMKSIDGDVIEYLGLDLIKVCDHQLSKVYNIMHLNPESKVSTFQLINYSSQIVNFRFSFGESYRHPTIRFMLPITSMDSDYSIPSNEINYGLFDTFSIICKNDKGLSITNGSLQANSTQEFSFQITSGKIANSKILSSSSIDVNVDGKFVLGQLSIDCYDDATFPVHPPLKILIKVLTSIEIPQVQSLPVSSFNAMKPSTSITAKATSLTSTTSTIVSITSRSEMYKKKAMKNNPITIDNMKALDIPILRIRGLTPCSNEKLRNIYDINIGQQKLKVDHFVEWYITLENKSTSIPLLFNIFVIPRYYSLLSYFQLDNSNSNSSFVRIGTTSDYISPNSTTTIMLYFNRGYLGNLFEYIFIQNISNKNDSHLIRATIHVYSPTSTSTSTSIAIATETITSDLDLEIQIPNMKNINDISYSYLVLNTTRVAQLVFVYVIDKLNSLQSKVLDYGEICLDYLYDTYDILIQNNYESNLFVKMKLSHETNDSQDSQDIFILNTNLVTQGSNRLSLLLQLNKEFIDKSRLLDLSILFSFYSSEEDDQPIAYESLQIKWTIVESTFVISHGSINIHEVDIDSLVDHRSNKFHTLLTSSSQYTTSISIHNLTSSEMSFICYHQSPYLLINLDDGIRHNPKPESMFCVLDGILIIVKALSCVTLQLEWINVSMLEDFSKISSDCDDEFIEVLHIYNNSNLNERVDIYVHVPLLFNESSDTGIERTREMQERVFLNYSSKKLDYFDGFMMYLSNLLRIHSRHEVNINLNEIESRIYYPLYMLVNYLLEDRTSNEFLKLSKLSLSTKKRFQLLRLLASILKNHVQLVVEDIKDLRLQSLIRRLYEI